MLEMPAESDQFRPSGSVPPRSAETTTPSDGKPDKPETFKVVSRNPPSATALLTNPSICGLLSSVSWLGSAAMSSPYRAVLLEVDASVTDKLPRDTTAAAAMPPPRKAALLAATELL
jgi:hypothetical protein